MVSTSNLSQRKCCRWTFLPVHFINTPSENKDRRSVVADIVIIGAGLTGLSAAYHLEKKGFYNYKLFEKEGEVGGLCRSVLQDGFTFDYTGHLIHVNDPYFQEFIKDIAGIENFNAITRRSYIYSQERYSRYPYQVNLHGLPKETIIECIEGFIARKRIQTPHTFHDWVLTNFGAGFAHYFFFPYQEKIFDYPVKKLSASWTGRFVPQTSLKEMLGGALEDAPEAIGYNANFLYPRAGGIFFWVEKLFQRLQNKIYTNHCVKSIDIKNKIIYFTNGSSENYKQLITTMPLDRLLRSLKEPSHLNITPVARKLLCNSVINFNIGVNRPDLSDKHWIYFPEKMYPFYRVGFPHNFAQSMAPEGCSSLYGEVSYLNQSVKNSLQNPSELLTSAHAAACKLLRIMPHDIATEKIIPIPHAYVIYNAWRDKNIQEIHNRLHEQQIYSVGRYGEWKYASMQENILDGKKIADQLILVPNLLMEQTYEARTHIL